MKVLGIDPSVRSTGFGIIEYSEGSTLVLSYGVIKPRQKQSFHLKINEIREGVEEVIRAYDPDEVVIENPFHAQNIKTAITLGQVRGAALVAVAALGKPLFEYSALEIKKAVTGYGRADKDQVQIMVCNLLNIHEQMESDASDALAAAFCHLNNRIFLQKVDGKNNKRGNK